jgi:DNA-binding transcriptional MerR regulator
MLIGEILKATKCKRPTFDRYARLGLMPYSENQENGYREFDDEAVSRVQLIRVLMNRPFRLDLNDIKKIFEKVPIATLTKRMDASKRSLQQFLLDKDLLD